MSQSGSRWGPALGTDDIGHSNDKYGTPVTNRPSMLSTFGREQEAPSSALQSGDVSDITDDEVEQVSPSASSMPSRAGSHAELVKQALVNVIAGNERPGLMERRQSSNNDLSAPGRLLTNDPETPSVAQSTPQSGASSNGSPAFTFNDPETPTVEPPQVEVVPETQTKEYWLTLMNQKDAEMTAVRHELEKLKTRIHGSEMEIEEAKRKRRLGITAPDMEASHGKESVRALIKRVYSNNKAMAEESHPVELRDNAVVKHFTHTEPGDFPVVKAVKQHGEAFQTKLSLYLQGCYKHDDTERHRLAVVYHRQKRRWKRALQRRFDTTKADVLKRREYFESIFPTELKRAAGEQPVPTDLGEARVTRKQLSNATMFVDIDNDPNLLRFKGHTVLCPRQMVGYERQQQVLWTDHNGVVADSMEVHQELGHVNVWTRDEADIFYQRFMQHPKRFHKISAALPNKTTAECVKYYYLHKKRLKFKEERDRQRKAKAEKLAATKAARMERAKARALAAEQAQLEAKLKREALEREQADADNDDTDDNNNSKDKPTSNSTDSVKQEPHTEGNKRPATTTTGNTEAKRPKPARPELKLSTDANRQSDLASLATLQQSHQQMAPLMPWAYAAGVPLQLTNRTVAPFLPASVATSQPLMMTPGFANPAALYSSMLPVHLLTSQAGGGGIDLQRMMQQQQQQVQQQVQQHAQQQAQQAQQVQQQQQQQLNDMARFVQAQMIATNQAAQQAAAAAAHAVAQSQQSSSQAKGSGQSS
eukprot:m.192696 g.192696  ORF g.192696 m.192696 type:complete len:762 (-) comp16967_c0_seq1:1790-4075(-)